MASDKSDELTNQEPGLPQAVGFGGATELSVTTLTFKYAKTMPQCPHWYAVRSPENEQEYIRMYEMVREHGVYQRWRGRKRQYWYASDGFKYWVMTSNVAQSRILNRTRIDEPTAQPDL
jgi:hypothetical protein